MMLPVCVVLIFSTSCHRSKPITIAVIPRRTATMLWEAEHLGAKAVARRNGLQVFWNAPTREDNIAAQVEQIDAILNDGCGGLVLAPDHSLALITPVRRAIARGLPVVVVGSRLAVPPEDRLSYVVNDDKAGARMAGERVGSMLHNHGTIAILGIDPGVDGLLTRARSLEQFLLKNYPDIRILAKRFGSYNPPREQQVADEVLKAHPELDAIVALTSASARGTLSAFGDSKTRRVRVIAFDPDPIVFDDPYLDSFVVQDTQKMGAEAVRQIIRGLHGSPMQPVTEILPLFITRTDIDSKLRELTSMIDTWPVDTRAKWMVGP